MRHRLNLKAHLDPVLSQVAYSDTTARAELSIPRELYVELGQPSTLRAILDTGSTQEVTVHPDLTDRRGLWPKARRTR